MNAYDIAKDLDREGKFPGHVCYGTSPLLVRAANMLRKQADRIKLLEQDGMVLIHHIAYLGEEKKKLHLQKSYIAELESTLDSSIRLNKEQAERHKRNDC